MWPNKRTGLITGPIKLDFLDNHQCPEREIRMAPIDNLQWLSKLGSKDIFILHILTKNLEKITLRTFALQTRYLIIAK